MSENIYDQYEFSYGKKIIINKLTGKVEKESNSISNEHPTDEIIEYINSIQSRIINQNETK